MISTIFAISSSIPPNNQFNAEHLCTELQVALTPTCWSPLLSYKLMSSLPSHLIIIKMGKLLCCLLLLFLNSQLCFSSPSTSSSSPPVAKKCHPNDSSALLQLKNALLVINSTFNNCIDSFHPTDNWKESTDCCSLWSGVICDESTGHVVDLVLSDGCLQGSIPSNSSLFLLSHLQRLDLKNNNFSFSSIPSEFGKLNQLQSLDLSSSCFSGEIPDTFGNLSKLNELYLAGNNLSGQFPPSIFGHKKLQVLDLGSNHLVGQLPFSVSGLSTLNRLDFSHNMLSGRIPSWLFTIPVLDFLDLSYNNLIGPIDQFQQPNSVREVYLQNNKIHGPIPSPFELVHVTHLVLSPNNLSGVMNWTMFQNLSNLQVLDLSNNTELSLSNPVDINFNLSNLETLNLSSCNIREFPTFLGTFQSLISLDLSYNAIGGHITQQDPNGWESLSSLNLSHNSLIAVEQHPWNNINYLDLRWNSLQGPLITPPASTEYFMISNNQLSGEIPSSICNLDALKILDLSHNKLKGVVPQCIGSLSNSLSVIDLRNNTFHGSIPETFEKCENLGILNVNHNNFEGNLPRSLANCTSLEILDLGRNNITDTFPHWLEPLSSLRVLILRANSFFGTIGHPEVEHPFPKLQILDLSHNKFNGTLPAIYLQNLTYMMEANVNDNPGHMGRILYNALGRRKIVPRMWPPAPCAALSDSSHPSCSGDSDSSGLSSQSSRALDDTYYTSYIVVDVTMNGSEFEMKKILYVFTTIDISSNQFIGEIPPAIGMLKSLVVLNFSHNGFIGCIPSTLGNLTALESLDLSSNKLVGEISPNLTSLTFLAILNLSYNQLTGRIPQGKQFDTFSNDSYIGNLGLCGSPLSNKCESNEPTQVPSSRVDNEETSEGWFNWKHATLMGYGCGLVLGLSMGYIIFTTGRPSWFVIFVEHKQYEMLKGRKGRRRRRRV